MCRATGKHYSDVQAPPTANPDKSWQILTHSDKPWQQFFSFRRLGPEKSWQTRHIPKNPDNTQFCNKKWWTSCIYDPGNKAWTPQYNSNITPSPSTTGFLKLLVFFWFSMLVAFNLTKQLVQIITMELHLRIFAQIVRGAHRNLQRDQSEEQIPSNPDMFRLGTYPDLMGFVRLWAQEAGSWPAFRL